LACSYTPVPIIIIVVVVVVVIVVWRSAERAGWIAITV
jgi:hypothetical protein